MIQEDLLYDLLKEIFPREKIFREYTFSSPNGPSNGLRLDFFIPARNLAIEYDGIQHRQFSDFYHKSKTDFYLAQNRDEQKEYICSQLGISLVRFNDQDTLTKDLVEIRCLEVGFGSGEAKDGAEGYLNRKVQAKLSEKTARKKAYDNFRKSDAYKEKLRKAKEYRNKKYYELKEKRKASKTE